MSMSSGLPALALAALCCLIAIAGLQVPGVSGVLSVCNGGGANGTFAIAPGSPFEKPVGPTGNSLSCFANRVVGYTSITRVTYYLVHLSGDTSAMMFLRDGAGQDVSTAGTSALPVSGSDPTAVTSTFNNAPQLDPSATYYVALCFTSWAPGQYDVLVREGEGAGLAYCPPNLGNCHGGSRGNWVIDDSRALSTIIEGSCPPSPSPSVSPSTSPSPSHTASPSLTPSSSPSMSPSPSVTPSTSPSLTPSASPSMSPSPSVSASPSLTPSVTPSRSASPSASPSTGSSPSSSPSRSGVPSRDPSAASALSASWLALLL